MEPIIDQKIDQVAELLRTLAHPLRMQIVLLLSQQKPCPVSSLQVQLQAEQSLLSHHLIKMKDKGILTSVRKGKEIYYSVAYPCFMKLVRLLLERKPHQNPGHDKYKTLS